MQRSRFPTERTTASARYGRNAPCFLFFSDTSVDHFAVSKRCSCIARKHSLKTTAFRSFLWVWERPIGRKRLKKFSLSFPIICDPEKKLYNTFGIGRGSLLSMASPAFLLKGFKTLSRGHSLGIPKDDVLQMPGVFLIDTSGNIRYAHYSKDPSDNPSIGTLLALKDVF